MSAPATSSRRRPGHRPAPAQAGPHPSHRPLGLPDGKGSALGARGAAPHLVEAEIAACEDSNHRGQLKAAGFPVEKNLEEFKVQLSSVSQATFDNLASLEWIRAKENLCLFAAKWQSCVGYPIGRRSGGIKP